MNTAIKVDTRVLPDGNIEQTTDYMGEVMRQLLLVKEQQIIDALIQLGWTPPPTESGERK